MADVVVIGGGVAGLTAARLLAERGRKVTLCRRTPGRSAHGAGAWQLAHSPAVWAAARHEASAKRARDGAPPDIHLADPLAQAPTGRGPSGAASHPAAATLAAHVADIALHQAGHPFAKWGIELSVEAILRGTAPFIDDPHLAYLPMVNGALQPAVPDPLTARVAYDAEPKPGIVAVLDLSAYGAPLTPRCVLSWQHDANRAGIGMPLLRSIIVSAAPTLSAVATAHAYGLAQALQTDEGFAAFTKAVGALLEGTDEAVWLPPVLGLQDAAEMAKRLSEAWGGRPVFEASGGIGSPQGPRRLMQLERACTEVNVSFAPAVASADISDQVCTGLVLTDGMRLQAKQYVLATGRFVGGGLHWPSQQRCREALFGLPLHTDMGMWKTRSVLDATARLPNASHEWAVAGVVTDDQQRPLSRHQGDVLAHNVRVVGGLLGGWNELEVPSRDGVALVSASVAVNAIASDEAVAPQGAA